VGRSQPYAALGMEEAETVTLQRRSQPSKANHTGDPPKRNETGRAARFPLAEPLSSRLPGPKK